MHKTKPSEKKVSDGFGAENQTTRVCVPHTPYKWDLGFMQATACCKDFKITPHYLCSKQCRLKGKFQTALEQKPKQCVRTAHTLRMGFVFHAGYGSLYILFNNVIIKKCD
ncbi:TPA: hypothetical protein ACFP41_001655 [Neisseria weaveri]